MPALSTTMLLAQYQVLLPTLFPATDQKKLQFQLLMDFYPLEHIPSSVVS